MASSDAYEEWGRPPRWRRWTLRLLALVALAACAYGLVVIVREATDPAAREPATLRRELVRISASTEALSLQLEKLGRGRTRRDAREALPPARRDLARAERVLEERSADGPVQAEERLRTALDAHAGYLSAVAAVLRNPSDRLAGRLGARGRRARRAFDALPDPAGIPVAIRGYGRLATWAERRGRRG